MRKDNYQDFQGNDQYEGFCVDMLRELADILKFSFKIKLVDDGLYGAPEPNGSWTGMVGELINRVSSLPLPLSSSCSLALSQKTCSNVPTGSLQTETHSEHMHTQTHTHTLAPNHNSAVTSHVSNCPQRGVRLLSRTKADLIIPQKKVVALPKILCTMFPFPALLLPSLPSLFLSLTRPGAPLTDALAEAG